MLDIAALFENPVVSIATGGLISALISYIFARQSREERRAEFDALFRFLQTDEADDVRIERDAKGRPQTIRIKYAEMTAHARSSASIEATKIPAPNDLEKESDDD
jgi:hypothetical protein